MESGGLGCGAGAGAGADNVNRRTGLRRESTPDKLGRGGAGQSVSDPDPGWSTGALTKGRAMIRQADFSLARAERRKEAPLPPLSAEIAPGLKNGCMASWGALMGMLRGESSRDKGAEIRAGRDWRRGPAGQDWPARSGRPANASQDSAGEGANRPRPRLISPRAHNRLRYNATAPTGPRRSGIPEAPGYSHLAVPPPSPRRPSVGL